MLRYIWCVGLGGTACIGILLSRFIGSGERFSLFQPHAVAIHKSAAQEVTSPLDRAGPTKGVASIAAEADSGRAALTMSEPPGAWALSESLTSVKTHRSSKEKGPQNSGTRSVGNSLLTETAAVSSASVASNSPPTFVMNGRVLTSASAKNKNWNHAESVNHSQVVPMPEERSSDDVDSVLAALEIGQNAFLTNQKRLQLKLKNADEFEKDEIRKAMQESRELFVKEQKILREELKSLRQTPGE